MNASPSPLDLVRDDLRAFAGYASARRSGSTGSVWLNANEAALPNPADPSLRAHRYPDPQPQQLRERLAELYAVKPGQLLVGRGSDEAIDLLVRALCRPGIDAVAVAPPVFGMYAVSARLQGAPLVELALVEDAGGFRCDPDAFVDAVDRAGVRLIFLCSPANPTGQSLTLEQVSDLTARVAGRALVVVDEAYVEYSGTASATTLLAAHPNLAVLRTLSKAHALAAARIGCLIADPGLVAVLRNCQAPYPLPAPSVALALAALEPAVLAQTAARVEECRGERERVFGLLAGSPLLARVYRSDGNYLLARFFDADAALARLLAAGVVVRDMRAAAGLGDALRISIGSRDENDQMLRALGIEGGQA